MRSRLHYLVLALVSAAVGLGGVLLLAEVALRLLPTNDGLRAQPVNAASPIFRFEANRRALQSKDWNFSLVNIARVNNHGFVNDQDYDPAARTPLLAVVGDSYIEARFTPFAETVQGRLAAAVGSAGRVYSFAASGAGLSQYIAWIRFARASYRPDAILVSIVGNDFKESLYQMERSPGFHHFDKDAAGAPVLRRVDYAPSTTRRVLRESGLVRYLASNLQVQHRLNLRSLTMKLAADDQRWVGNIAAIEPEVVMVEYKWAVRAFLDLLPESAGLPPERIIVALDGFRPEMYDRVDSSALAASTWGRMRAYVAKEARARHMTVIDLHAVFEVDYARNQRRFEYPTDNHWSGEGHRALAEAVMQTPAYTELFGRR